MESHEEQFRQFVSARMDTLRGLAYLTCGNWQAAEDAVARSLAKLYTRWGKIDVPERYAARMVVRAAIDEVRRPWRREVSAGDDLPEVLEPDGADSVAERMHVRAALRKLPPGQRAVLVLRYYAGFSVDEVATALGRRPGTVKSQTARGLATLRTLLAAHDITVTDSPEGMSSDARYTPALGNS